MGQKRKLLTILAVIAVIVVAVPITFVELNTSKLPPITVNSQAASSSYTWRTNLSSPPGYWDPQCTRSFDIITENGY
ncbi:MAG: hypothetical protein ACP5OC_04580 [Thermoplasmata archaeon]